ncbi:MAG: hypothetical protein A2506_11815 [Elusimicrobia bacterium RIFOXYD12_FULL_66_9]|nr:MAG: hypothetical protein A2506_11815 [Elusimicrobia bacterium RIFOXYD12_FULL_66_9]
MSRATLTAAASLAAGSLAGGFARYLTAVAVYRALGSAFPYGTFLVNMLGCFFIGLFDFLAVERYMLGPTARLLLMTGFCGAFTTFSTLILDTSYLMKSGDFLRALINVLASVILGLLLFRLGSLAGRLV